MDEVIYSAHPDVIKKAIEFLVWAVLLMGGSLVGTLLYVWNRADARISNVEQKMDRIALSIEGMDKATAVEIAGIKIRCALLHSNDPHAHIRSSDLGHTPNNQGATCSTD